VTLTHSPHLYPEAPQVHITTPPKFALTTNNNGLSNDTDSESDIRAVATEEQKSAARARSLEKLVVSDCASEKNEESANSKAKLRVKRKRRSKTNSMTEGIIILKEERATIFHDFLKFIYPQYVAHLAFKTNAYSIASV
jgi:phage protein D